MKNDQCGGVTNRGFSRLWHLKGRQKFSWRMKMRVSHSSQPLPSSEIKWKLKMKDAICCSYMIPLVCPSHYLFLCTLNFPIYWCLILCKYPFPSLSSKTSGCAFIPPFKQLLYIMSPHCPWGSFSPLHMVIRRHAFPRLKKKICYVGEVRNKNKVYPFKIKHLKCETKKNPREIYV